ncbi:hypothetical protein FF100_07915 [Methylobacterium terricola]|uniref:Uncharacterized protein n=1 Tax=Methylobacterium terricola TaxID=2583531 RepID=A0A5C4LIF5_9HYPH|nr:hypothetical protein [Methylobacterium terricola]TNC14103.1 hypothetical protein FF100_07915 [Methylobacterium terricola]
MGKMSWMMQISWEHDMAIATPKDAPLDGQHVVKEGLDDLLFRSDDLAGGSAVDIQDPLPVYGLMLDDIKDKTFLDKAHLVGWRYIIANSDHSSFADVRTERGSSEFVSLASSAAGSRLIDAAELARSIADKFPHDCEARILDIPALKLSGIWLTLSPPAFVTYIDGWRPSSEPSTFTGPHFIDEVLHRAEHVRAEMPSTTYEDHQGRRAQ